MSTPVTIAILNYQRRDALRRALEAARGQRYAPLEILAVDNASTDGSQEMVRDEFPDVHLVALPANIAAAARNEGVRAAKGEIVFTLDNDVLFTTPEDVARGVAAFERHPRAAVVNFTILGPDGVLSRRDWCHPRDPDRWAETEFVTDYVLEGASACRREAFLTLMAFAAARAGELSAWVRGVIDAVRGSGRALDTRRAMSRETARRLAQIRALKPSILARARRHARERLI